MISRLGRVAHFSIAWNRDGASQALAAGLIVCGLLGAFAAVFADAATGAVRVWLGSRTFNHCFLVLPIALFLIWQRRLVLSNMVFSPDWRALPIVFALAMVWLAARFLGILEAQQFVVVSILQGTLLGVFGVSVYRKLAAPLLYLYFLVPSGDYLIPALQAFTAHFAVAGLHLLHIPVFSNGAVIEIPAGSFAVAEACAGLRFLIASLAFGVFFAVITYRSWIRRCIFIALSAVVPIIANGLRALGLIAAAEWIGNPAAAMADHLIYGWVFFSLVLVLLVAIGNQFSDGPERPVATEQAAADRPPIPLMRIVTITCACLVLISLGPIAFARMQHTLSIALPRSPPDVSRSWQETTMPLDWAPIVRDATKTFRQSFSDGSRRVDRLIALYGGSNNSPFRSQNRDADERMWSFDFAKRDTLTVGGDAIPARMSVWIRGDAKRTVWSFFVVNGEVARGIWEVKWNQVRGYLANRNCSAAYVALSTEATEGKRSVESLLAGGEPLGAYLCGSTKVPATR